MKLFDDLESGALSVARSGTGQQRPDRLDRLAVTPNDPSDVGLAKLHPKNRRLSRWDFGKHHLIGKFDELANDEFQKLFHGVIVVRLLPLSRRRFVSSVNLSR
jgi:hypothetical protein